MPAVLTHDFFGRGVIDDVSDFMGFKSIDERDAFLLGNQGPDPLFYLTVDPLMRKWETLGHIMHDARPARLMLAMREAYLRLEGHERQIARAYVAGFSCHWQLDSAMHPFVYFWQNAICAAGVPGLDESHASRVHAEIERDLDEMVLYTLTGKTVRTYWPHDRALKGSPAVLAAVDKLYFYVALWVYGRAVDPRTFSVAVKEFRLVQFLFDSPTGKKRALLGAVERALTRKPYPLVLSMALRDRAEATSDFDNREHRGWENPFTHERSTTGFWDLYEGAQSRVLHTIDALLAPDFDLEAARALTGDVNFEGAPTDLDGDFSW